MFYSNCSTVEALIILFILVIYQQKQFVIGDPIQNVLDKPKVPCVEIISAAGFGAEMYQIKNRNNSGLLTIYHIINPLANQTTLIKYPMLLGHGILSDASMMVSNYENALPRIPLLDQATFSVGDENIGFSLANNNFDVWLFDNRGSNRYSHSYTDDFHPFDPDSYYNFSADEQALEDLPTFIDFVLEQTQSEKLFYTGYSESSFFMLALLSTKLEYQLKVANAVLMAPIAYLSHLTGLIDLFKPIYFLPDGYEASYLPEPIQDLIGDNIRRLCGSNVVIFDIVCQYFATGSSGVGETKYDKNFYSTLFKGTSLKAVKHYAQLFFENRCGMYNYGIEGNMMRYGQPTPPDYDMGKIKLPTIITVRGGKDFISTVEDQQTLLDKLGTKPYLDIFLPNYNHLDYLIGKEVVRKIRMPVIKALYECLRSMTILNGDTTFLRMKIPIRIYEPILTKAPNYDENKSTVHTGSNFFNGLLTAFGEEKLFQHGGFNNSLVPLKSLAINADKLHDSVQDYRDQFMSTLFKPVSL